MDDLIDVAVDILGSLPWKALLVILAVAGITFGIYLVVT